MGVLSLRGKPRWAAVGSSALLATSALMLSSLASAAPASAAVGGNHGQPMPYRVFAPYFETYDLSCRWPRRPVAGVGGQVPVPGVPADTDGRLVRGGLER